MYLATLEKAGAIRYEIRQSYLHAQNCHFCFRTVFDLGSTPEDYLVELSEDICYFSSDLEDSISKETDKDPTRILETLLWDFLPEQEQLRLGLFKDRGKATVTPLSEKDRLAIEKEVHLFDRRRLYYLRYGAVDQSRLFRLNPKLYRPLLGQSRDEREYYFMDLEKVLNPNEMKTYVFAIFDLQQHFTESFSSTMPEALDQLDIADHFVNEICMLNGDESFWAGNSMSFFLHYHLQRYLIMFFDHGYGRRSLFDDFVREFMGRHRAFRWPEKKTSVSSDAIVRAFSTEWQKLSKMSRKEVTRLFRKRAKELHPDGGGNHEQFIELSAAYASLLARKK